MSSPEATMRTTRGFSKRLRTLLVQPAFIPVLGVLILLFAAVWSQTRVDRLIQELDATRGTRARLEARMETLTRQADRSAGWSQVEERAMRERGLISPEPDQIVDILFEGSDDLHDGEPAIDGIVRAAYAGRPAARRVAP
jgi:hypothetical protein